MQLGSDVFASGRISSHDVRTVAAARDRDKPITWNDDLKSGQ